MSCFGDAFSPKFGNQKQEMRQGVPQKDAPPHFRPFIFPQRRFPGKCLVVKSEKRGTLIFYVSCLVFFFCSHLFFGFYLSIFLSFLSFRSF